MKKIITHINPDSDSVISIWLIKRFLPGWQKAEIGFMPQNVMPLEDKNITNPQVLYVDVGRGELDHHQRAELISASQLCWEYVQKNRGPFSNLDRRAIQLIADWENQVDNVLVFSWEEVKEFRYYFYFHNLLDGLKSLGKSDVEVVNFGLIAVDAIFANLKNQLNADEELQKGIEFNTRWGKAIAVESKNRSVCWRGEVLGYIIVVKKDPETGAVRIYTRPDSATDLSGAYRQFIQLDPQSDWFLHQSKKVLLNQASASPNMRPTKLSLQEIIEILQKNNRR